MATTAVTGLRRVLAEHLGSRDVTRVIYGSIVGLALVVALEAHPPSAAQAAVTLLGAAVAVGLAEIYSEAVGAEARTRRRIGARELRRFTGEATAVTAGAGFPAVYFLLATAGALERDTAFTLAKWTGLGLICAYGLLAARLAGSGWPRALAQACAVGAIGGLLIALKAIAH